jgi:membrane-bound ClpP family serine protease
MDGFLAEPVVVFLSLTLAAVLFLVEVALPTFGIAGTGALALAVVGALGAAEQDERWWPILLLAALAVALWAIGVARLQAPHAQRLLAAALFAAGTVGFAVATGDVASLVLALVASAVLPAVYPWFLDATAMLMDEPPVAGMESFIGRRAEVVSWHEGTGVVRLDGSLWRAACDVLPAPEPGSSVAIRAFAGLTLQVAPDLAPTAGGPPAVRLPGGPPVRR